MEELIFVGYTNGYQILYAKDKDKGEGTFYPDTGDDCFIPLYMLKSHAHRLETTTDGSATLDMIKDE